VDECTPLRVGHVVSYVRRDPMYADDTRESARMTAFVEWIMFDTEFFFLGAAVQVDSIKTSVESAFGFSA
jgi:hypothetical protein